jgi:hypothetical protein
MKQLFINFEPASEKDPGVYIKGILSDDGTFTVTEHAILCEECQIAEATHTMYPAFATDEDRSNGPKIRSKMLCDDCAREAFESGDWESNEN